MPATPDVWKFICAMLLIAAESYLLGSLNSAIIVCRIWKKTDIRTVGSHNAGLTNTLRVFGKGPAAVTLAGDLLKGVIAVLIGQAVMHWFQVGLPYADASGAILSDTVFAGYVAGICAIIGHIFPIYYKFKGGKGVLVSCSILLVIDPLTFCIMIPFFLLIVLITKYVSVGSITAAAVYPIVTGITQSLRGLPWVWLNVALTAVTAVILIYMHRSNIQRLRNGTENKFGVKKVDAVDAASGKGK